jgi:hypothetical protein
MNENELDIKIAAVKELTCHTIAALEKLANEKFAGIDKALNLQSKEYERRLEFLNGEADRLKNMQATYLSRELYDTQHETLRKRIDILEQNRANVEGKASQSAVNIAYIISAIGIIIGIAGLLISVLSKGGV